MRAVAVLVLSVGIAGAAWAQQAPKPDPVSALAAEWQAYLTQQTHVQGSLEAIVSELQAARARVKLLEDENSKLRGAGKASGSPSAPLADPASK